MEKIHWPYQNMNKENRKTLIAIILLVIIAILIFLLKLDESKFWNEISAIGSILAFIGVIITIIHTEKSRKKQNIYETKRNDLKKNQKNFEECVKEQIDLLNSRIIYEKISMCNLESYNNVNNQLDIHISKISQIKFNISWYNELDEIKYDLSEFYEKLEKYEKKLNQNIISCLKLITSYESMKLNASLFNNDVNDDIKNKIIEKNMKLSEEVETQFKNILKSLTSDECKENYSNLCYFAKDTVNSRNDFINKEIEKT